MEILSKITPAETTLIREGTFTALRDLLKLTFMDLLFKKVIEIKEVKRKAHPRDSYIRTYNYVIAGKNLENYKAKNHELIFLSPFLKSPALKILFANFIKMAVDTVDLGWDYKKLIRSNPEIQPYFNQSFLLDLFHLLKLTGKGKELKKEIAEYLNEIDNSIVDLFQNDQEKALKLIISLGGNIFLLKNLDFKLLKTIDKEFLNQHKALNRNSYENDSDYWLYLDFFEYDNDFGSYFDSFDQTLNSFDFEFEASSCSSDNSGCSSCGGGD